MNNLESGIDQLIDRVKKEAIDKAKDDSLNLVKLAEQKAKTIIDQAKEDAHIMLEQARALINQEKRLMVSELQMAARDASVKLTEKLKEQMLFPIIKEHVRATLKQPDFLREVLQRLITECVKESPASLDILVPKELKTTLAAFFAGAVFDKLDQNSDIRLIDEEGIEGFALIKRGEHYVWDFRADTISLELMRLVEPSLRKYFTAPEKSPASYKQPVV